MPVFRSNRVKTYFSLFGASDFLLTFFENHDIPLKVAVEFVRYEKGTNEGHARRLVARYFESPLTAEELAAFRKRKQPQRSGERDHAPAGPVKPGSSVRFFARLERLLAEQRTTALTEIEALLGRHGYRLVPVTEEK